MGHKLNRIPENWPQAWRREYISVISETPDGPRKSHVFNAAKRHVEYCTANNRPLLACQSILEHGRQLRGEISSEIAGAYAFALARIAWKGRDKALRDQLHEHFADKRTPEQILQADYVPRQARLIGLRSLVLQELSRRDLVAFDLYLRVVDRLGELPASPSAIVSAFWSHPPGNRHQCAILGKAAAMIDLLLPGHVDANSLRIAQRALRPDTHRPGKTRCTDPEIDTLVESARQVTRSARGRPYSKKKKAEQRGVLIRFKTVLEASGRSFALDRPSIDIFAVHTFKKFRSQRDGKEGWSAIYAARTFETLATFVSDPTLRQDLLDDAADYHTEADKEPKAKERVLSKRPTTLPDLFRKVGRLVQMAPKTRPKSRARLVNTAAALALLCVYPLRRADLIDLRFGEDLIRVLGGWCLASLPTQKTGLHTEPLRLPDENTPALDAALLQGASAKYLWKIYSERCGQCLWADWKTGRQHSASLLTQNLKSLVEYSPHIFRTLWADHLVANGADREKVSVVLQHRSLISQKDYEVLASKLRLSQGIAALAKIGDDTSLNGPALGQYCV
jgi:integrase